MTRDRPSTGPGLPPILPGAGSALTIAVAEALPRCIEIVLQGRQVRANIETAVRAIEVSHGLRLEAVVELERMIIRYHRLMPPDLLDAYFAGILRLLDAEHYAVPWAALLPRR